MDRTGPEEGDEESDGRAASTGRLGTLERANRMGRSRDVTGEYIEPPTMIVERDEPTTRFATDADAFAAMVSQLNLDRAFFYDAYFRAFREALGNEVRINVSKFQNLLDTAFRIERREVVGGPYRATAMVPLLLRIHAPAVDGARVEAEDTKKVSSGKTWEVALPGSGWAGTPSWATFTSSLTLEADHQVGSQLVARIQVDVSDVLVYLAGHEEPIRTRVFEMVDPQSEAIDFETVDNATPALPDPLRQPRRLAPSNTLRTI